MLKDIFQSDIKFQHLLLRLFLFGVLTVIIMYIMFPICFWLMYGEGASADRISNTIFSKILWFLSPSIVLIPFTINQILNNYKRGEMEKSKEYVYVSIFIFCFSVIFYLLANWGEL